MDTAISSQGDNRALMLLYIYENIDFSYLPVYQCALLLQEHRQLICSQFQFKVESKAKPGQRRRKGGKNHLNGHCDALLSLSDFFISFDRYHLSEGVIYCNFFFTFITIYCIKCMQHNYKHVNAQKQGNLNFCFMVVVVMLFASLVCYAII